VYGAGTIVVEAQLAGPVTLAVGERTAYYGDEVTRVAFELPDPPRGEVRAEVVPRRGALAPPERPIVRVGEGDDRVDLWVKDDVLELWYARPDVISDRIAVIDFAGGPGALGVAGDRDVRGFQKTAAGLQPVIVHVDGLGIDTLGAPLPGTLIAAVHGPRGFALAARLDADHAYVAALTTDGTLVWVSPLAAPTGIAMSDDVVVAFHDGATLAIFPLP
jgi:hypothetical protein